MIATQWGITRQDCDEFGKLSQDCAAKARANGCFESQILLVEAPVPGDARTRRREPVDADEGPRETTLEGLAGLQPTLGPEGIHTAGTSSQIKTARRRCSSRLPTAPISSACARRARRRRAPAWPAATRCSCSPVRSR